MNNKEKLLRKCSDKKKRKQLFKEFKNIRYLFDKKFRFLERKAILDMKCVRKLRPCKHMTLSNFGKS